MSSLKSSEDASVPGMVPRDPIADLACEAPPYGAVLWDLVVMLFVLQVVTGGLLMTVYAPATTTAWGSVHYIQTEVPFGWLIRGLHRAGSDAMIIALVVYLAQLLVTRLYLSSPRLRWSMICCLLALTAALAHTGYLLPWDQQAYWGTKVRTNIVALTPLIGPAVRRALLGGSDLGQASITRFFTLHVLVLPLLFVLLIRLRCFRRRQGGSPPPSEVEAHSCATKDSARHVRRALVFTVVLIVLVTVSWYLHQVPGSVFLAAPADPATSDYPARPEWYALFLFQWLKFFEGYTAEAVAAIVVPGVAVVAIVSIPFGDRFLKPRTAHTIAATFMLLMLAAWAGLTGAAIHDDRDPSDEQMAAVRLKQHRKADLSKEDGHILSAWGFNRAKEQAQRVARRAHVLAERNGIAPAGPLELLATDAETRGPQLFAQHCASCHRFDGHNGLGGLPSDPATASDLAGYASRSWIRGLLADPMSERYFGLMRKPDGTPAHTRMAKWTREARDDLDEKSRIQLDEDFDAVAAYLEDESLHAGRFAHISSEDSDDDTVDGSTVQMGGDEQRLIRGRRFFMNQCNECHSYQGYRYGTFHAPEMFGYGSVEWIALMIAEPDHETRYRTKGREPAQMPPFRDRLTLQERHMIAQWLHESRNENKLPSILVSE